MSTWWSRVVACLKVLQHLWHLRKVALALRIFLFAAAVPVLLRLPLPRLYTLLEPCTGSPPPEPARVHTLVSTVEAILQAGRPLLCPSCLTRGLTLYYFLRRAGLRVTLCFGIGAPGDTFVGHCWLAKDGEPFLEARDPRLLFTVIYSFPEESRALESGDQESESRH